MKHTFEQKVYYADTDAYGVVWHGTYLRWMEKGRVDLCESVGLDLVNLQKNDIALPVTNMNVRYKASARLNDTIVVETYVSKITPVAIRFTQTIKDKVTDKLFIQAEFDVVAISNEGKLHRRMPEILKTTIEKICEGG